MNLSVLFIVIMNFIYIGLLPIIFFKKKDGYNLKWWLVGSPFFLVPVLLILGYLDILPAQYELPYSEYIDVAIVFLSAVSIGWISMVLGTHRVPLHLWHQKNDDPHSIITFGAYKWVRHPFYTSFLLTFMASALILPHIITVGVLIYCYVPSASSVERKFNARFLSNAG